jgi:hypothetical protein
VYVIGEYGTAFFFDGHTWQPIPVGETEVQDLFSISGTSPSNLFCVDSGGMLLHYDGHAWTQIPRLMGYDVRTISPLPGGDFVVGGYYGTAYYHRTY